MVSGIGLTESVFGSAVQSVISSIQDDVVSAPPTHRLSIPLLYPSLEGEAHALSRKRSRDVANGDGADSDEDDRLTLSKSAKHILTQHPHHDDLVY